MVIGCIYEENLEGFVEVACLMLHVFHIYIQFFVAPILPLCGYRRHERELHSGM